MDLKERTGGDYLRRGFGCQVGGNLLSGAGKAVEGLLSSSCLLKYGGCLSDHY